ncbi:alpha/beta hydrolase [Pseudonocardia tropica]|uniref:Alpha/beta hydrolase n=1 Tax=Pseudonocardia tropica TaxID=681289 RepID=A0ABV1K209_9PSEU
MTGFVGWSANGVPYARLGGSGPPLVVITGSELEHRPPTRTTRLGFRLGLPRLTRDFAVYLTSRRPDMPAGYSARDMSEDVAALVRSEIGDGPVHVMGMSSGGSSAMHLAVDHPDLVDRLVLAMTAHRLAEHGREVAGIWRDLALAGDWPALYARMGVDVAEGAVPDAVVRIVMRLAGKSLLGTPCSGADFATVLDSDVHLDVAGSLGRIAAPTLVVGGENDPFYGADNITGTARLIPGAPLCLLRGGGHAVVKQRPRAFETAVLEFLREGSATGARRSDGAAGATR